MTRPAPDPGPASTTPPPANDAPPPASGTPAAIAIRDAATHNADTHHDAATHDPATGGATDEASEAGFSFRDATPADVPTLLALVAELAAYERLAHEAVATPADLHESLFGPTPRAHALLAGHRGEAVGLALYFFSFSTFTGRPSLYVEDVYVQPAHRGQGLGRAFFRQLAQRAVAERCGRMEWSVLDWNEPALRFYRALGAQPRPGWTTMRLTGPGLAAVATSKPGPSLRPHSSGPEEATGTLRGRRPDPPGASPLVSPFHPAAPGETLGEPRPWTGTP